MKLTRTLTAWTGLSIPLTVVAGLIMSACAVTKTEDNDTTNSFITVSESSSEIFSDVCNGTADGLCTLVNDNADVSMVGQTKDFQQLQSTVQDVVFERYRVTYIRADGRNVPGVDVPFPFDGVANFRVPIDGNEITRSFMIVRQQAKAEAPLAQLQAGGGATIISVIAQVDFFGRDIAGRPLQVTAFYNISFADFPG